MDASQNAPRSARQVEKAIKEKYGENVRLYRDGGVGWWFADHEQCPDEFLVVSMFTGSYVYVPRLRDMSLDRWIEAYGGMRAEALEFDNGHLLNRIVNNSKLWVKQ
jgi:hypothetical protein